MRTAERIADVGDVECHRARDAALRATGVASGFGVLRELEKCLLVRAYAPRHWPTDHDNINIYVDFVRDGSH